jgi:hypothetical protein
MNGTTIASSGNVASLASNIEIEVVEDTNGDGRPDLVIMNTTTGVVAVLLGGGGSGSPGSVPADWEIQN